MYIFFNYLKFLLKAKDEHGVHSPFVFNLITKSLQKKDIPMKLWTKFEKYKGDLNDNKTLIEVEDFGAGSKRLKSNRRSVRSIARNAGISQKRARILYHLIDYLKPQSVLEIGTSLGLATSVLSLAQPSSKIKTLEGCSNTLAIAKSQFTSYSFKNIETVIGEFGKTLPTVLANSTFDFIFIDGNHTKEATLAYFDLLLDSIHNDSCLVFDDIYWSQGMKEAWIEIQNHPKVTVSIDTFQWGIVFFRKEQRKEHFTIRL